MKPITVATLKLLGGHWALDFTNTINSRGVPFGPDLLQCYEDLIDWGLRVGVLDGPEAAVLRRVPAPRGKAALARAKSLREAIYRIMAAPLAAAADDLDLLQREAGAAQQARLLEVDGDHYAWRWRSGDPDSVTTRIALAATDLLTGPALARVHVCPGDACAWLFLDKSRSGRRIWCSEEGCGTRNRVRRWRAQVR